MHWYDIIFRRVVVRCLIIALVIVLVGKMQICWIPTNDLDCQKLLYQVTWFFLIKRSWHMLKDKVYIGREGGMKMKKGEHKSCESGLVDISQLTNKESRMTTLFMLVWSSSDKERTNSSNDHNGDSEQCIQISHE